MTAYWIGGAAAAVVLLATWRLRRASRKLSRILDEERDRREEPDRAQATYS